MRGVLKIPTLLVGAALAAGLGFGLNAANRSNLRRFPALQSMNVRAPQFPKPGAKVSGTTWIDSPPLTWTKLRGKVVMIDFWEYTCINCIRTFANNKLWYERYHKYGFEIIGVHAPEFSFAYNANNVRAAVKRFALPYPIVVDDWFTIWKSYHNTSWPERYLVDANGVIRYRRVGEGGDHDMELAIRELLEQAHPGLKFPASDKVIAPHSAFAAGCGVPTDEMYMGPMYPGRGCLANPRGYKPGETQDYRMQPHIPDGHAVISGKWQTDPSGMIYEGKSQQPGPKASQLKMRYHARQLYSVINVVHGKPSKLYIQQDGHWLTKANAGVDVKFGANGRSYIEIDAPRMYYLVANPRFGSHEVTLFPTARGLMVDSFTFGNNCQLDFPHL